jgi:hypothetical protein
MLKGVTVEDTDDPQLIVAPVTTNENAYFQLKLKPEVKSGQSVLLQRTGSGYQTATMHATAADDIAVYLLLLAEALGWRNGICPGGSILLGNESCVRCPRQSFCNFSDSKPRQCAMWRERAVFARSQVESQLGARRREVNS